ncbi:MAG: putative RNA methyltransferase [Christensenellales bacterium]
MEKLITKKNKFKQLCQKFDSFACPICESKLLLDNDSLKCANNHTFNINGKGFVVLLKKQKNLINDIYTKELFENRRKVILNLLYNQMYSEIANFINKQSYDNINIFEFGSGESSHSYLIKKSITKDNNYIVSDLSKEAIDLSTDYLKFDLLPIICDAYNVPIESGSIDYIIDILSPYSHKEIYKILKDSGYVIKVFPEKDYLKELRKLVSINEYTKEEEVLNNFGQYFEIIDTKKITRTVDIDKDLALSIFYMTPMTNNCELNCDLSQITISLKIVFAKKKGN